MAWLVVILGILGILSIFLVIFSFEEKNTEGGIGGLLFAVFCLAGIIITMNDDPNTAIHSRDIHTRIEQVKYVSEYSLETEEFSFEFDGNSFYKKFPPKLEGIDPGDIIRLTYVSGDFDLYMLKAEEILPREDFE